MQFRRNGYKSPRKGSVLRDDSNTQFVLLTMFLVCEECDVRSLHTKNNILQHQLLINFSLRVVVSSLLLGNLSYVRFIVLNLIFNNISVISARSVLLEEETGEIYWLIASHWQTLSHNVVSSTPRLSEFTTLVVIDTNCIESCKCNYHMITTTTAC
jgi:hypothetical protein